MAARLGISREEAVNELWELKRMASLIKLVTPGFWLAKVIPGNRRAASKI
ncbi:DNA-binding protein [Escherichia coli]